jgi:hypothetical protein
MRRAVSPPVGLLTCRANTARVAGAGGPARTRVLLRRRGRGGREPPDTRPATSRRRPGRDGGPSAVSRRAARSRRSRPLMSNPAGRCRPDVAEPARSGAIRPAGSGRAMTAARRAVGSGLVMAVGPRAAGLGLLMAAEPRAAGLGLLMAAEPRAADSGLVMAVLLGTRPRGPGRSRPCRTAPASARATPTWVGEVAPPRRCRPRATPTWTAMPAGTARPVPVGVPARSTRRLGDGPWTPPASAPGSGPATRPAGCRRVDRRPRRVGPAPGRSGRLGRGNPRRHRRRSCRPSCRAVGECEHQPFPGGRARWRTARRASSSDRARPPGGRGAVAPAVCPAADSPARPERVRYPASPVRHAPVPYRARRGPALSRASYAPALFRARTAPAPFRARSGPVAWPGRDRTTRAR